MAPISNKWLLVGSKEKTDLRVSESGFTEFMAKGLGLETQELGLQGFRLLFDCGAKGGLALQDSGL